MKGYFGFLQSNKKRGKVALKYDQVFRGNIIIGKCGKDGKDFRINPRLANKIPKEFARFCRL